jgi:hypothetical protein
VACGLGALACALGGSAARADEAAAFLIASYAPDGPGGSLGERASLALQGTSFTSSLQAEIEGNRASNDAFGVGRMGQGWTGAHTSLTASWAPASLVSLDVALSNQIKRSFLQIDPLTPGLPAELANTETQSAKVSASVAPSAALSLKLGGEAASQAVQTPSLVSAGVLQAPSDLRNQSARAFAELNWKPTGWFTLEAEDGLQSLGVSTSAPGGQGAAYTDLTPRLAGSFMPWAGGAFTLSAQSAVTAPNAAQFASFIETPGRPTVDAFQPDREWRYVAGAKQTLGDVVVSAHYTVSRLQTVTDLGPVGSSQAPINIGAGRRSSLDIGLAAPIRLPGLPAAKLDAQAGWTNSAVTDPFTGQRRPVSGDAAYRAQLNLSGALPLGPLSWTLKANVTGPSAVWQMSQVDYLSATAGLGGSLGYDAGPVRLALDLDNIVGGDQADTSVMYAGSRAFAPQDGLRQNRQDNRAVRISISRPL